MADREGKMPESDADAEREIPRGNEDEDVTQEPVTRGGSPGADIDAEALRGGRTSWQESTDPAAGDPITEEERRGQNLLGRSDVRDGAIWGTSDEDPQEPDEPPEK